MPVEGEYQAYGLGAFAAERQEVPVRKTVGEVAGDVAVATAHLLRVWAEMPPVAQLELREVAPELTHALDGWHAAEVALLAAKQQRDADAARLSLTKAAWAVAAVHEGMPR